MSEDISQKRKIKYIFVTGGVVSSVGKGIASASLGLLLESRGYKIAMMKIDPYINVDPGTMNPFEHGEVFVTDDGAETDLDLGHYQRFTNAKLTKKSNTTTGAIYYSVIRKEREGAYSGKTVQVIPHITGEIKNRIRALTAEDEDVDIAIVEIGGTVGDIESLPFLEAIRQFRMEVGPENCCFIHVTHLPYIEAANELKTKPTQHSVRALRDIGIQPNVIICRTGDKSLEPEQIDKVALFCEVPRKGIINAPDISPVYLIPLNFKEQNFDLTVLEILGLDPRESDLTQWINMVNKLNSLEEEVRIAAVGKYTKHGDAYKSINEAFIHAGIANNCKVSFEWIDSKRFDPTCEEYENPEDVLAGYHGILVGPGFGGRGVEGKINVVRFARENKIPYFGICFGMQIAVIEFARNFLGMKGAHTTEIDPATPYPVISLLTEQKGVQQIGGTMRLGAYSCEIKPGTIAAEAYKEPVVYERHRHRYEFNNKYRRMFEEAGMIVSGVHHRKLLDGEEEELVEIIELKRDLHPWFCASQFHPEFKSTPLKPQPLFCAFIRAALEYKKNHGP
ncbi:MAG: CTP synthase [Candidatus Hydrogenedentes bacterium]|nr:CTP synthase [Candidatus Hydrogenedentota bacterium]